MSGTQQGSKYREMRTVQFTYIQKHGDTATKTVNIGGQPFYPCRHMQIHRGSNSLRALASSFVNICPHQGKKKKG